MILPHFNFSAYSLHVLGFHQIQALLFHLLSNHIG